VAHDGVLEHFGGKPIAVADGPGVFRACARFLDLCHPVLVPRAPKVIENPDGTRTTVERWNTWQSSRLLSPEETQSRLRAEIERAEAWAPDPAELREFRRQVAELEGFIGDMLYIPYGAVAPICPFDLEQGLLAYADYPGLVRRWNRAVNGQALRHLETRADPKLMPVCILWNDIAAKGGLIYPPAMLAELFYPHLRRQIELLHARGIKVVFHSDGDATAALPALMDCGIDAFNPLEITAGMRVERFREICGRRVVLVGGIDAVGVLARGTPAEVAAATRQLIDAFRADGNLMVASASGQIDNSMPLENVLAMYATVWESGKKIKRRA
jgi:hypothetical protein